MSQRKIARQLNRSPSTISRELQRNGLPRAAALLCSALGTAPRLGCRPKCELVPGEELFDLVVYMLRKRYSSEQIAGKLRTMEIPAFEENYVCRETIYNAIYALPVGESRKSRID